MNILQKTIFLTALSGVLITSMTVDSIYASSRKKKIKRSKSSSDLSKQPIDMDEEISDSTSSKKKGKSLRRSSSSNSLSNKGKKDKSKNSSTISASSSSQTGGSTQPHEQLTFYQQYFFSPLRLQVLDGKKFVADFAFPDIYMTPLVRALETRNAQPLTQDFETLLKNYDLLAKKEGLSPNQVEYWHYIYCLVYYQFSRALSECKKPIIQGLDTKTGEVRTLLSGSPKQVKALGDDIYAIVDATNVMKNVPNDQRGTFQEPQDPHYPRTYWLSLFHDYQQAPFAIANFTMTGETLWLRDYLGRGQGNLNTQLQNMTPEALRRLLGEVEAGLSAVLTLSKRAEVWLGWDGNSSQFGNGTDIDGTPTKFIKRLTALRNAIRSLL